MWSQFNSGEIELGPGGGPGPAPTPLQAFVENGVFNMVMQVAMIPADIIAGGLAIVGGPAGSSDPFSGHSTFESALTIPGVELLAQGVTAGGQASFSKFLQGFDPNGKLFWAIATTNDPSDIPTVGPQPTAPKGFIGKKK